MNKFQTKPAGMVRTVWEVWTYDVWGNQHDGWEVNDRCCINRGYVIYAPATLYNVGIEGEFRSASPSDEQIMKAFGLIIGTHINTDNSDDTSIYVTLEENRYPIGELICMSHDSLSPVGKCNPEFTKDAMGEGYE